MTSPQQLAGWLDANAYRMDLSSQYLGTEPNALNRDWDSAVLRWLMVASWPYEHAAGNQSIPAVCKAVTDASPRYLADRFYLPATPRDMRLLERGGIPVFGIESKHPLRDFDVVGTSISYLVLLMNFCKMLSLSGVPLRWRDRQEDPGAWPMVIIGGQAYSAPGAMEPVADCLWLGEAESEPGNGGMAAVCARIEQYKTEGSWRSDRIGCYEKLALEFSYLHFPRFVQTFYSYQERGLLNPSKQVSGYVSLLPGMAFPRRARKVHDLNRVPYLDKAPLLFADPALGAGDLEVARGCIGEDEYVFLPGRGIQRLGDFAGDLLHPVGLQAAVRRDAGEISHVLDNGVREVVRVETRQGHGVTCTPDHRIWTSRGWVEAQFLSPGDEVPVYYGQGAFGSEQELDSSLAALSASTNYRHPVDGRRSGNRAQQFRVPDKLTPELAWVLGFLTGDGGLEADGKSVFFMSRVEEPEVAECVTSLMLQLFGLRPTVKSRAGVPVIYQYVYSAPLVRWLCGNFGYSLGKATERSKLYVPEKVLRSPREVHEMYLRGLFEADMCCGRPPHPPTFSTISGRLARQVSAMLLNLGVPCSFSSRVRKSVKGFGGTDWEVSLRRAGDASVAWLRMVAFWKDERLEWYRGCKLGQGSKFHLRHSYVTATVKAVTSAASVRVLDLHVPEQEAFNASGFVVHNCPAWCGFCRLSWLQKPYRQSDVARSVEHAAAWHRNMGAVELSPFAPDFPMHTLRTQLISRLLAEVDDEVDSVAMRVDDFIGDPDLMMVQALGGMDAVTLGLEGNSQRMRDLVGKGTSDQEVIEAVTRGIRAGIRKFKLFMITNLPGEEPGDVLRIVQLAEKLAAVRDELGQPSVRIQFSWTPLLIEAGTPMQWFAPTPPDHTLIQVADLFRNLRIDFKIGTKAEPNKIAFFQLCQRASAETGEAIIDVLAELDVACWGGVPRDMQARLDAALREHGFLNGLADAFDERFEADLFGWEYIDTGVSRQLMWETYLQMVEFLEYTDAATYDEQLDPASHGQEFIARCDTQCLGNGCGVCSGKDLKLRQEYIRAGEAAPAVDVSAVRPVDQSSVAQKVLLTIRRPVRYRFVGDDHWRFAVRRAAYQAAYVMENTLPEGFSVAKRSIRFASDGRDDRGVCGRDYAEFGLTRELDDALLGQFLAGMQAVLYPWLEVPQDPDGPGWVLRLPRASVTRDAGAALYVTEVAGDLDQLASRMRAWDEAEYVPLTLRKDSSYFGLTTEEVNARDYVDGMWLASQGSRLLLKMVARGPAGPYQLHAALLGKGSWIEASRFPARRADVFTAGSTGLDALQGDLLSPQCTGCGLVIPVRLSGQSWSPRSCPQCEDEAAGHVVAALSPAGV